MSLLRRGRERRPDLDKLPPIRAPAVSRFNRLNHRWPASLRICVVICLVSLWWWPRETAEGFADGSVGFVGIAL